MKGRFLAVAAAAATLLLGSGIGHANVSRTDGTATTIEPILTRSSFAVVRSDQSPASNKITNANITAMSMSASGGAIRASMTVKGNLIRDINDLPQVAPYAGQHLLMMFQTAEFEDWSEVIGRNTANTADVKWESVSTGFNRDRFYWFLHWGYTPNKDTTPGSAGPFTCGVGIYDPTGALVEGTPTMIGQLFSVLGEDLNNTSAGPINTTCTVSADGKTVNWTQPYRYEWKTRTGDARSKQLVNAGQAISNVTAFTWLDHEIGGPIVCAPPPAQDVCEGGLILGWTWYTDALPSGGYQVGAIAGDPNPNSLWTPQCTINTYVGTNPVTGAPQPCTAPNPVGSGFVPTNINFTPTS